MLTADSERVDEDLDPAGESQENAAQATAQPPKAKDTGAENGNACSNCHQPLPEKKTTVCPHCGYYFSLGICIELDQTWERLAGGPTAEAVKPQEKGASKSQTELVMEQVPGWAWKLIGCNAAILLLSIFARVAIPSGLPRTLWSVTQLFAGVAAFLACHAIAYLVSIAEDASMSVLDVVLKPFKLWKDVVRELPNRFYVVAVGSCGVTAAIGSVLIIGALNYEVLLDWNISAPPKRELMGAIAEAQAKGKRVAAEVSRSAADKLAGKTVEKNVRVDCVIVGYTVDPRNPNAISSLLIAREYNGSLKYVGSVTAGLSDAARLNLFEDLAESPRDVPIVSVPPHVTAKWVQPDSFCRIKCVKETEVGGLVEMEFDEALGAVN